MIPNSTNSWQQVRVPVAAAGLSQPAIPRYVSVHESGSAKQQHRPPAIRTVDFQETVSLLHCCLIAMRAWQVIEADSDNMVDRCVFCDLFSMLSCCVLCGGEFGAQCGSFCVALTHILCWCIVCDVSLCAAHCRSRPRCSLAIRPSKPRSSMTSCWLQNLWSGCITTRTGSAQHMCDE